jgi:hypothetical protein
MELSVIRHDASTDAYVLNPGYNSLFIHAARAAGSVSPDFLAQQRAAAELLGTAVEKAIVSYERKRLGSTYAGRVKHIALLDAAAGYDVESVTVESDATTLPRLIEVKAVPIHTLRFFWTSNEIAAARRFGLWYFLYLVPIAAGGEPDIHSVRIISDPCSVVLESGHGWFVEPEAFRCELIRAEGQGSDRYATEAARA